MMISAGIILMLGSVHLIFTFLGSKLLPRDSTLQKAMEEISPNISVETTMWKSWVGFNASHSLGAIFFGVIYSFLTLYHPDLLFGSIFLRSLYLIVLLSYLALGYRYWFRIPFRGIAFSTVFFILALVF